MDKKIICVCDNCKNLNMVDEYAEDYIIENIDSDIFLKCSFCEKQFEVKDDIKQDIIDNLWEEGDMNPEEKKKREAIQSAYFYMNYHLQLLNEAIKNKDVKNIVLQKDQLKKVREMLLKLGYFK